MSFHGLIALLFPLVVGLACVGAATAAPFDVYYRPSEKGDWVLYGGRESRAGADTTATDLARASGFETKVFALGEPVGRPAVGPRIAESISVGGGNYVRRPGLGYVPGWHRWGAGWGGGYGGDDGGSTDQHHSSHHHFHEHHSSHHSAHHATDHPSHSAAHSGARRGSSAHQSSAHHSHTHSHSHSHHSNSHGGHRK